METNPFEYKCCYRNCNNDKTISSMFGFPVKDPLRLNIWLRNSGNTDIGQEDVKRKRICSAHFHPTDLIHSSSKCILTQTAIPFPFVEDVKDEVKTEVLKDAVVSQKKRNRVDINKPIMQLFKRLINNDNKENTILTNAQIIEILQKEFDVNIAILHELQMDIYLTVMKKFLKDWPLWDEFDKKINWYRKKCDDDKLAEVLGYKYNHLKKYLQVMLEVAQPLADQAIEQVQNVDKDNSASKVNNDVCLEIACDYTKLPQLINRHPIKGDPNKMIFNNVFQNNTRIVVSGLSLEQILRLWFISFEIDLRFFNYTHDNVSNLQHRLVNKKLSPEFVVPQLMSLDLEMNQKKKKQVVSKESVLKLLKSIVHSVSHEHRDIMNTVCRVIVNDINRLNSVYTGVTYRRYLHPYPYVRYLYKEVEDNQKYEPDKYDLQIEEKMSLMSKFRLSKCDLKGMGVPFLSSEWFKVQCNLCKWNFRGFESLDQLQTHVSTCHLSEPKWQCVGCKSEFSMDDFANNVKHIC